MSEKTVGAARFQAECLKLIDQVARDRTPITILKRGRPVAILAPIHETPSPFVGAMAGTVLGFDDPFSPAADPSDWNAAG